MSVTPSSASRDTARADDDGLVSSADASNATHAKVVVAAGTAASAGVTKTTTTKDARASVATTAAAAAGGGGGGGGGGKGGGREETTKFGAALDVARRSGRGAKIEMPSVPTAAPSPPVVTMTTTTTTDPSSDTAAASATASAGSSALLSSSSSSAAAAAAVARESLKLEQPGGRMSTSAGRVSPRLSSRLSRHSNRQPNQQRRSGRQSTPDDVMGGAGLTTSSLKLTDRFGDDNLRTPRQPGNAVADETDTTGDDPNRNHNHRSASGGNDVNASGVKNVHASATNGGGGGGGGGGITTGPVSSRPSRPPTSAGGNAWCSTPRSSVASAGLLPSVLSTTVLPKAALP